MFRYFLTGIYRNVLKDKVTSLINLVNLTIGFTTFILLGMVVSYEFSFDKFNTNFDRIYRVQTKQEDSYPINYCTFSPAAFRYHLMADQPEVEQVLLMREVSAGQGGGQFFQLPDGSQLFEKDGYFSENAIFDIFSYHILEGNPQHALDEPNQIMLSEKLRQKLFPEGNAVGKKVLIGKRFLLTVVGVYADLPYHASLRPSYLVSLSTYELFAGIQKYRDNWTYIDNDNFVLLRKGADPARVNERIHNAFKEVKNFEKSSPYLHPLSKMHISPNSQPDMIVGLSILSLAGLLVLVLSCVNYVNLSLAGSTRRAAEIGIKKVVGFSGRVIAVQFIAETLVLTFLAMILGMGFAQLASPMMANILRSNAVFRIFDYGALLVVLLGTAILAGIASGLYPALVLASYNPIKVLKGKLFAGKGNAFSLRKVLTTAQFSISLFMLIVSLILYAHVNFILNKDLGFESRNLLFTEIHPRQPVDFESVRQRLLVHPEIVDATFSNTIPFQGNIGGFVSWDGAAQDQKEMISRNYVNYEFVPTFGLKMLYGRNFSKDYPSDDKSCLINETALKVFGWKDPIGKQIFMNGRPFPVIGVVKDFHPFSVHNPIPSYIMFLKDKNELTGEAQLTVRFSEGNKGKARDIITAELSTALPDEPFEVKEFSVIFYLDLAITFWQSMKKLFFFFAVVTLLISSMGLFGLILFTTKRRTKEIGVRKVLGSSVGSIYTELSSEVVWLIGFAILVACPAAILIYRTMPGAYKEPLNLTEFLLAIAVTILMAFLTITYHVLKVAVQNPVKALRYE
ncbi:MAG: ABC transporter permease [Marinilabiliales bacterium]|nr:ABC transporter permease [Marinilabiliales bacterium]